MLDGADDEVVAGVGPIPRAAQREIVASLPPLVKTSSSGSQWIAAAIARRAFRIKAFGRAAGPVNRTGITGKAEPFGTLAQTRASTGVVAL